MTPDIPNTPSESIQAQWAIIGAGPAGIGVVGKLLDAGIDPCEIVWVDPDFKVGDFGQKWRQVSSNTTVKLFREFLMASPSFDYKDCPNDFAINHLPAQDTCLLNYMANPLQWISDRLAAKVRTVEAMAKKVDRVTGKWVITANPHIIHAHNVVLAIGAEPHELPLASLPLIAIDQALDKEKLAKACSKDDTVAVFGSSHSAIVALYNLEKLGIKVVNFHRSPLKYAVNYDDWILYDNTGLKGYSAQWARENLEDTVSPTIERISFKDPTYESALSKCTKAICAIGFGRRNSIHVVPYPDLNYDASTGIIGPGLFGHGIAFPIGKYDREGNYEYRVGLWKFMCDLTEILPMWMSGEGMTVSKNEMSS